MLSRKIKSLTIYFQVLSAICFMLNLAYGQRSQGDIPHVTFKNRQFDSDIPYGVPFLIKTSSRFENISANICAVKIWFQGASERDSIYAYDWIHKDENRTEFELKIGKGLRLDRTYYFEFLYLMEESYSSDQRILTTIIGRTRQFFNNKGYIGGYNVDTIIKNIELELINSARYTTITFGEEGQVILKPEKVKLFEFSRTTSKGVVTSDDFAQLAREFFLLEEAQKKRNEQLSELRKNRDNITALLKDLANNNPGLEERISRVIRFIESGNYNSTSNIDVEELSKISCSEECEKQLRDIESLYTSMSGSMREINEHSENIKNWENKIGTLSEVIIDGIRVSGIIATESVIDITDKATYDRVKIGTAFGGSFAFPNTSSINNIGAPSTFGYFALKFYLKPVDRGLKDPYLSDKPILNRTSILVGLKALGNLEYKGTQLENIFGTQPVFGVSYDIHRNFSIDIGTVLFRQSSVYPLISGESPPRAALTIGLSFDPDLINRFRTLVNDEKYRIN